MKLSELSYRDYIAIEVIGHLVHLPDKDAAWRAYGVADALLAEAGKEGDKRDREIAELRERAGCSERALSVLRETLVSMLNKKTEPEKIVEGMRALFGVSVP